LRIPESIVAAEVTKRTSEPGNTTIRLAASAMSVLKRTRGCGLLRLMGFFCLMVLVAFVLDRVFTVGLRRIETSEFGASNKVFSGQVNANIVISGSSRALVHYDPRIIQNITGLTAYNLGRNAAQTDMQCAFLKTYLNTTPGLKS